jgi:hypothetical protein
MCKNLRWKYKREKKKKKKRGELKRRYWCHLLGLDFLFQKTPIMNPKKRTVQAGDAFEGTRFQAGFGIVKTLTRL